MGERLLVLAVAARRRGIVAEVVPQSDVVALRVAPPEHDVQQVRRTADPGRHQGARTRDLLRAGGSVAEPSQPLADVRALVLVGHDHVHVHNVARAEAGNRRAPDVFERCGRPQKGRDEARHESVEDLRPRGVVVDERRSLRALIAHSRTPGLLANGAARRRKPPQSKASIAEE